eukprot:3255445-Rhodomonas_salina.1
MRGMRCPVLTQPERVVPPHQLEGALFGPIVYDRASSYYIDRQQSVLDRLERGNAPRQGAPPGSDPAPPPVLAHSTSAQSARSAQSAQDGNPSS